MCNIISRKLFPKIWKQVSQFLGVKLYAEKLLRKSMETRKPHISAFKSFCGFLLGLKLHKRKVPPYSDI